MPLDGSGSWVPVGSTVNPAVTNTAISSTDWNALITDLRTSLSTAMFKDGQATPTANIGMGGFRLTGLAPAIAAGNALRYEQLFSTSPVALLGAMDWFKGADIASNATVNLTTATGNAVHITGTTTITAVTLGSGLWRQVIFDGILMLTHHATNNNLPGGVNITTAAGDRALYWSDGTTVYCTNYTRANGKSLLAFASTDQTITSAGPLTLAHGLAVTPTLVAVRVRCTSTESNYSVNDLVWVPHTQQSDSSVDGGGVAIIPDATNLNIRFGSRANVWTGTDKTTGGGFPMTNAKWVATFFAWVI